VCVNGSKSHHPSGGTKLFPYAYYPAWETSGGSFQTGQADARLTACLEKMAHGTWHYKGGRGIPLIKKWGAKGSPLP